MCLVENEHCMVIYILKSFWYEIVNHDCLVFQTLIWVHYEMFDKNSDIIFVFLFCFCFWVCYLKFILIKELIQLGLIRRDVFKVKCFCRTHISELIYFAWLLQWKLLQCSTWRTCEQKVERKECLIITILMPLVRHPNLKTENVGLNVTTYFSIYMRKLDFPTMKNQ